MRTSVRNKNLKRLQKYLNKKQRRGRRKQRGEFLNWYDFAYAGRDTANQAVKGLDTLAPKVIGQATKEIEKIAEARIRQVINDGRQQIQKTAPQIIWGAIEDLYKTPFRLLGNLGKKKFSQLKRKLSKTGIKWTKMNKITDKIYHSCATRYANGERKLIDFEKYDMYLVPTSDPFWKEPTSFYRMQPRNSTKKRELLVGPFKVNKINLQKYNFSLTLK